MRVPTVDLEWAIGCMLSSLFITIYGENGLSESECRFERSFRTCNGEKKNISIEEDSNEEDSKVLRYDARKSDMRFFEVIQEMTSKVKISHAVGGCQALSLFFQ